MNRASFVRLLTTERHSAWLAINNAANLVGTIGNSSSLAINQRMTQLHPPIRAPSRRATTPFPIRILKAMINVMARLFMYPY